MSRQRGVGAHQRREEALVRAAEVGKGDVCIAGASEKEASASRPPEFETGNAKCLSLHIEPDIFGRGDDIQTLILTKQKFGCWIVERYIDADSAS